MGINILASGQKGNMDKGIITIYQNTTIYSITGDKTHSAKFSLKDNRHIYLVVSKGNVTINDIMVNNRDGVYIKAERELEFIFQGESEMILLDLPSL